MHPNSMQACIDAKRKPEYHAVGSAAAKKTWAQEGYDKAVHNNICLACNGKYKSSYGHTWSWVDGDEARSSGVAIL